MRMSVPEENEGRRQRLWTCTVGRIDSLVFKRDDFWVCKEQGILDKKRKLILQEQKL